LLRLTSRADGNVGWAFTRAVPLTNSLGEITEWCGASSDISKRKEIEAALVINDERLQMALSASGQVGLWDWMVDTDLLHGDANFARLYGLDVERTGNGLTMEEYQRYVAPEDLEPLRKQIRRVFELGGDFFIEYRLLIPEQPLKWVECRGKMLHGNGDVPLRFSGTAIDITERKAAEQQKHLLMKELSHRVSNTFAVVQAIAFQSLRGLNPEKLEAFQNRLIALSRSHEVLLRTNWESTDIHELVRSVLRLDTEGHQFDTSGPDVEVGPQAALSLSLLLHELTTNATKYGALSVENGRVILRWDVAETTLFLAWREAGGPPSVPPSRRGFGSVLIERGIAGSRDVQLNYGADGFAANFKAPLERVAR
jgi:two-component sensor histidine kinase/PAS domain-containing protein